MTVVAWLLVGTAALALAYWVAAPLAQPGSLPASPDHRLAELVARREELAALLHDLELDVAGGRVSVEEHEALRQQVLLEGAMVMTQLAELAGR